MSITAAQLIARVSVEGVQAAQGQLLGMGNAASAAEARFRGLAVLASGLVVAGLIAVGVVSAKMAGDFQQAVNRLKTGAGDTQDSFNTLAKGILGVSVATGVMTGPLNKAMYEILSSGQRGAQAFDTLTAAAKGAVIEQAKVVDVADTLAGTMTNFGTKTFGAVAYMNGLITAVSRGRITLQDLSTAMGPIEPVAHAMGISFSDLAAAMSTQTNAAIPAARAATGLRFMMQALEVPTTKARNAMTAMGLDSVKVAEEMKVSLPGALQMIYNAAMKAGPEGSVPFNRAVSDMVGGQRSLSTFLALTGGHMKDFSANAKAIAASMKGGAGDVNGWALAQTNFNVIMDKAKASIAAAAIGLGLLLLPALGKIVAVIPQLVDYFSNFSQHANVLVPILSGIAVVVGGILAAAMWSLAAAVWAAIGPFILVGAAVAGLVAIFMHLYSTNPLFKAYIDNLVNGFKELWSLIQANFIPTIQRLGAFFQSTILPALQQIGSFLVGTFRPAWEQLVQTWNSNLLPALKMLWGLFQTLLPVLKVVGAILLGVVVVALAAVVIAIVLVIKWLALLIQGWSMLISFMGAAFSAIGTTINRFGSFVGAVFSAIGTTITNFKNMMGGVFSAIGATFNNFKNLVGSVFSSIGSLFPWLYDHNTYIKALVNVAVAAFNTFKSSVGSVFSAIGSVVNNFRGVMGNVFSAVGATLNNFRGLVGSIFSWIGSHISSVMSSSTGSVRSFGSNALSAIGSFVGGVISKIGGLVSQIAGFLGGLAGRAFGWGASIIQGLINGITDKLGALGGVVSQAAGILAKILGFHASEFGVPPEGPGHEADKWMPALMKGLTGGIQKGMPAFHDALSQLMVPVGNTLSGSAAPMPVLSAASSSGGGGGGGGAPVHVHINVAGRRVADAIMPDIVTAIRNATGARF